jgi:putative ATP-binding cassette transporter
MNLIAFLFQRSRKLVTWSVVTSIISGISNATLVAVVNSALKRNGLASTRVIGEFLALCLVLPASRYVSELLLNKLGQEALYDLRIDLSRQILMSPLVHLEQLGTARLMAALTEDVPALTSLILILPALCLNAAILTGCLIYMGLLSPMLLLMVLSFIAIGAVTYQIPVIKAQEIFRKARRDSDALQEHFRALTYGTKELKIHGARREAFLDSVLDPTAQSVCRRNIAAMKIYTAAASWGQTLVFIVTGLIVLVLPRLQHLSYSVLTAYTICLLYLMSPLQGLLNVMPAWARACVALNKIKEIGLSLSSGGTEQMGIEQVSGDWRTMHLSSVCYSYIREGDSTSFVLGPFNLLIHAGDIIFVTGGNGSGKTTFAKLLCGLYTPQRGQIWLDGEAISSENQEYYREHFSVVFSDSYLFDQLLGLKSSGLDDQANEYLNQLHLAHIVQVENGRLSTLELSQGQRKRLALLTAYLEDRSIYVFDEWAANQDSYFKNFFYYDFLPELKSRHKTVFVITHDDRYFKVADRVLKLEAGQIISDTHNTEFPAATELKAGSGY